MVLDLSIGFIGVVVGFIGPIEVLGRIVPVEGGTFIFGPSDGFGKLPRDIGPFPGRFNDGGIDNEGPRGLNDGCPCEGARKVPEFCDIYVQKQSMKTNRSKKQLAASFLSLKSICTSASLVAIENFFPSNQQIPSNSIEVTCLQ